MSNSKKVHKIKVIREKCVGATTCVVIAPEAFKMDDDNIAIVRENAPAVSDSDLFIAAQCCPTQAIILYNDAGEQIFPPIL